MAYRHITINELFKDYVERVYRVNPLTDELKKLELKRCFFGAFFACIKMGEDCAENLCEGAALHEFNRYEKEVHGFIAAIRLGEA
jgi:hypothetical protein